MIVQTYEDQGISGAKGRDQRPAFDQMLKDAVRRQFDVLMVWSIDRLGRSVLHVANALAELDAAGVALYSDQQAIDSTTPMGRAMIQMASVFGEQERQIIRSRVLAGLDRVRQQGKKLGRPKVSPKIEGAIREHLSDRAWHPQGGGAGRCRQRNRAAGEAGDGWGVGGMPQCGVHPEPTYGAACLYPPIAREGRGTDINSCTTRCRPAPTCHP